MKHLYLIALVFLILSCSNQDKLNLEKEQRILEEKTEYFRWKLDQKYLLNPEKISFYAYTQKDLDLQFEKIDKALENNDSKSVNNHINKLIEFVEANEILQSNYIQKFIVPSRTNIWTSKEKNIYNKDYLKLDMLKLQSELIEFLYHEIESDYYKFNKLIPIVIDSSNTVKKGEIYEAQIMLAAFDSTHAPNFIISDINQPDSIFYNRSINKHLLDSLLVLSGTGLYKMKTRTIGKKGFKGMVEIKNPNGEMEGFIFTHEFNVIEK
jgi:hypothetical protein